MRLLTKVVVTLVLTLPGLVEAHCLTKKKHAPKGDGQPEGHPRSPRSSPRYTGPGWCAGDRYIGLLSAQQTACPAVAGWQVGYLFDLSGLTEVRPEPRDPCPRLCGKSPRQARPTRVQLLQLARDAGLDRFCVFDRGDENAAPPNQRELRLDRLDPDYCAVAPAATHGLVDDVGPTLHDLTLASVALPPTALPLASVRLAILDTLPTGNKPAEKPENLCSRHGDSLFRLASELSCRNQNCPVSFTAQLAMGTDATGGKPTCDGGKLGFIGEIGAAAFAELADWTLDSEQCRIVLNLSLGWNGHQFGGFERERDMPANALAVYRALEVARSAGALVFAAAGNATPGPKAIPGPLLPAGWERRTLPSRVYAVSGLTERGKPVPNSRPGSQARRATFGGPAAVSFEQSNQVRYTPALTGTSVAAAVTSALAAAHWARNPDDRPAELVRRIDREGTRLGWRSDSSLDFLRRRSRHVLVGSGQGVGDPIIDSNPQPVAIKVVASNSPHDVKNDSILDQPLASPQPGADPCPPCQVDPPKASLQANPSAPLQATLRIELDPAWEWNHLQVQLDALEVELTSGGVKTYKFSNTAPWWPTYSSAAPDLTYSVPFEVGPESFDAARLYWVVKDTNDLSKLWSALSTPWVTKPK